MICEYKQNNECIIASYIADKIGENIPKGACEVCLSSPMSKTKNAVTMSLAIRKCKQTGDMAKASELINYFSKEIGPGTELKKSLSWFYSPKKRCKCNTRIQKMNIWGPDECEKRIVTILRWLKHSARIARIPYIEFVVKIVVLRAINKSRLQLQQHREINVHSVIAWHQSKVADGTQ